MFPVSASVPAASSCSYATPTKGNTGLFFIPYQAQKTSARCRRNWFGSEPGTDTVLGFCVGCGAPGRNQIDQYPVGPLGAISAPSSVSCPFALCGSSQLRRGIFRRSDSAPCHRSPRSLPADHFKEAPRSEICPRPDRPLSRSYQVLRYQLIQDFSGNSWRSTTGLAPCGCKCRHRCPANTQPAQCDPAVARPPPPRFTALARAT